LGPDPVVTLANLCPFGNDWLSVSHPAACTNNARLLQDLATALDLTESAAYQCIAPHADLPAFAERQPEAYLKVCASRNVVEHSGIDAINLVSSLSGTDLALQPTDKGTTTKAKRLKLSKPVFPAHNVPLMLLFLCTVLESTACVICKPMSRLLKMNHVRDVIQHCLFDVTAEQPIHVVGKIDTHRAKSSSKQALAVGTLYSN